MFHAMASAFGLGSAFRPLLVVLAAFLWASAASAAPKVVVTIKPVHALTAQVMAGVGEPVLLVQGMASPHTFSLRPSDARQLNEADVFIRVSEQVEPFTRRLVGVVPATVRVVSLVDAPGLLLLPRREGGAFEAHTHAEKGHGDDAHEAHEGADDEPDDGLIDGHVWLDPENAKAMVKQIAAALIAASPEDAARFTANADAAVARLDALQADLSEELQPVKQKPFVVFHDALQYYERRFDLMGVGAIALSPEVRPSAKRLHDLRAKLSALGPVCVFKEPAFSGKLIDVVAEGLPVKVGTLDPEGLTVTAGPDAFDTLMRNLATGLRDCLL